AARRCRGTPGRPCGAWSAVSVDRACALPRQTNRGLGELFKGCRLHGLYSVVCFPALPGSGVVQTPGGAAKAWHPTRGELFNLCRLHRLRISPWCGMLSRLYLVLGWSRGLRGRESMAPSMARGERETDFTVVAGAGRECPCRPDSLCGQLPC